MRPEEVVMVAHASLASDIDIWNEGYMYDAEYAVNIL